MKKKKEKRDPDDFYIPPVRPKKRRRHRRKRWVSFGLNPAKPLVPEPISSWLRGFGKDTIKEACFAAALGQVSGIRLHDEFDERGMRFLVVEADICGQRVEIIRTLDAARDEKVCSIDEWIDLKTALNREG